MIGFPILWSTELRGTRLYIAGSEKQLALSQLASQALRNCINLQSCILTREGILSTDAIQALQSSCGKTLRELEINGETGPYYDVNDLLGFTRLERLSIKVADRRLIQLLPSWISLMRGSLKSLSIISPESAFVTDELLHQISKNVHGLTQFQLAGFSRASHSGVAAVLSCTTNLESLTIQGVSPIVFNIYRLTLELAPSDSYLKRLKAISIGFPFDPDNYPVFADFLLELVQHCPLESFTLLPPGIGWDLSESLQLPAYFVDMIVSTHGHRLKTFAGLCVEVDDDGIQALCRGCPQLEQLSVGLSTCDKDFLGDQLSQLSHLRSLHLFSNPETMNPEYFWQRDQILALVRRCSSNLLYIGLSEHVLEIRRTWSMEASSVDGASRWKPNPEISLEPYIGPQVPEAFLVMEID